MENKIVTKIFVVEDDEWYREYLSYTLSLDPENSVRSFASGAEFLAAVNEQPDIVTLDYSLPDMTGAMLLQEIKKRIPDAEAIIISEQDKIDTAFNN